MVLIMLLVPLVARAGKRSAIPPGHEQEIRALVNEAVAATEAAGELPVALDERVDVNVDRDRIRVVLHPAEDEGGGESGDEGEEASDELLPRLLVFHPEATADEAGAEFLAPGIMLECGRPGLPSACPVPTVAAWTPLAGRLAVARDPVLETIWAVEESGVRARGEDPTSAALARSSRVRAWIDRGAAIAAVLGGLGLLVFAARRRGRSGAGVFEGIGAGELVALLALLVVFVGGTSMFTQMLPLHEHNSFIRRSDCAIDERCVTDSAWSMTTLHVYGMLLERIPYRAAALAKLSLGVSVVVLVLVWALARRLAIELGRARVASVAGISAVAVLASNPVIWRLSGSASFWPWTLGWALGAALAGLWAARARASEDRCERLAGAVAWVIAGLCLAFAAGGNLVCLTLGLCLGLAPLCWASRWSLGPGLVIGALALGGFAVVVGPDYLAGFEWAFGPDGLDDSVRLGRMYRNFDPLLLDPRISAPLWWVAVVVGAGSLAALRWRRRGGTESVNGSEVGAAGWGRGLRVLAPVLVAYAVPAGFLGLAAGEVVGSGYPVGFINHHWELVFTAVFIGLALAGIVARLERARPGPSGLPGWLRWRVVMPGGLTIASLAAAPLAREGWRMATGERVLERELVALERSFARLPEHDLLVVGPQQFAPLTEAESRWDPLEVVFPVGFYEYAMHERGLEPALVVSVERMPEPQPGERVLLYVGSGLRSFQPHEIAAGVVPEGLERPAVARVRDEWELEVVEEFVVETEQHEAISQRLGADCVAGVELGFYWIQVAHSPLPPDRESSRQCRDSCTF